MWCEVAGQDRGGEVTPIGGDSNAYDALPSQTVNLDTYWMAKYPITCCQYQAFLDNGGYETAVVGGVDPIPILPTEIELPNHPRETVTWFKSVLFVAG